MKVLYDYGAFLAEYGGIAKYFSETISCLSKRQFFDYEISALLSSSYLLKEKKLSNGKIYFSKINFKGQRTIQKFINELYSLYLISQADYDIFHPTGFSDYYIEKNKKPTVITIHDMIQEKFFDKSDLVIDIKKREIENCNHIIAVSDNTKKDIIELHGIDERKISVIYHGVNVPEYEDIVTNFKHYILYVGARTAKYKNFYRFIEAIAPILLKKNIGLICTGWNFNKEEIKLILEKGIEKNVQVIKATNKQLNTLYKNALAFIYPSLYEGFGIPILEAFVNGCPVCLSNASCFPEIAGDAALYFNPINVKDMYNKILLLIDDSVLRSNLKVLGLDRVKKYTWEKSAKQTISVYNSV